MDAKTALASEELKMAVYEDMLRLAKVNKFNSLEKPKQLKLIDEPFTVDNDILTPTFKLKRNIAKEYFKP